MQKNEYKMKLFSTADQIIQSSSHFPSPAITRKLLL